jgi:DNA-binding MarR family transcriptional regulator
MIRSAVEPSVAELSNRLQVSLARLSRMLRREMPSPLGQSSLSTLATLAAEGPLRVGDLAAREGVRPPTMTKIVGNLEEHRLVERLADPFDRRAGLIQLTTAGEEYVAGTCSARASQLAAHLAELTPAQRRAIAAALPALEALTLSA